MPYRIGIDVGGTFTDLTIADDKGTVGVVKSSSTPDDPAQGVFDALELAAETYGVSLGRLLGGCDRIVHGTTISTNAVIQRKGAKTGLIITEGFQNLLYLREGNKPEPYNLWMEYPRPYVPQYLTLPVAERINAGGEVLIPLKEAQVRKAIRQLKAWGVEAVAVCLLWSVVNPVHEQRIAQIIEQEWPGIPYSISSDVQPTIREYRRASATIVDASLKPVMSKYVEDLQRQLSSHGFKHEFLMVLATGGVMRAKDAARKPVYTLLSGPAMAPIAGLSFAEQIETHNFVTIDMGGTSFDVCVVHEGQAATSRVTMVAGIPTGISTVEVNTIGAGGGSIAWVDPGGLLHVGPQSAGAIPGPACYKRGGEQPTVTDADLVLGYLNPDYFLGGRMRIDPKPSRKAIQDKVAKPLKLGLVEAAHAIFSVVNHNMIGAMEEVTIRQGVDPREYLLIAGGGAGPAHAGKLAQELGMKRVLVPRTAGAFCALGMLTADIKFDHSGSRFTTSKAFDFPGVNRTLAELERKGQAALHEADVSPRNAKIERFVDTRYPGQIYELEVPLQWSQITQKTLPQIVADFHDLHEKRYAVSERDNFIEFTNWRVVATGAVPKIGFPEQPYGGKEASAALKGKRQAYFEELGGFVETPIYEGAKLTHGNVVKGPAIIEEPATTVVVFPGSKVTVTKWGDYLMELP